MVNTGKKEMRRSHRMPRPTTRERADAVSSADDDAAPSPKLPHERDETADASNGVDRDHVARAAADIVAGREDTDCYGAARVAFRRARSRRSK